MKRSRFTEEQVIGILHEQEAGQKAADGLPPPFIEMAMLVMYLSFCYNDLRNHSNTLNRPYTNAFLSG